MHPKRIANPDAKRPKYRNKDMDSLVEACWEQGWWCERGKKYIRVYSPDRKTAFPIPGTPSDFRSYRNMRAQLRRAGLNV